jgi:RNA polymerase subunit RPABC4/transcription elongation factor Spt4
MTDKLASSRRRSTVHSTTGILSCPGCGNSLKADVKWCPACSFTVDDSMAIFPDAPPPLQPILDAVGLIAQGELRTIERARKKVTRRFPQFQWRVCIVCLPQETSLPLFGFWLLNSCPLHESETAEQRLWTVLLLINVDTGNAAVTTGYAAEPCVSDDEWKSVLSDMAKPWRAGKTTAAICEFFKSSQRRLERNWNRFGSHIPRSNDS